MIDTKDLIRAEIDVRLEVVSGSDTERRLANAWGEQTRVSLGDLGLSGTYVIVEAHRKEPAPYRITTEFNFRRVREV